ncbi:MAG: hypothetical protein IKD78_01250, partial [Bacteroidales bacterium]|nr:hypothetical protein [Bacteroidales bacterium]
MRDFGLLILQFRHRYIVNLFPDFTNAKPVLNIPYLILYLGLFLVKGAGHFHSALMATLEQLHQHLF